MGGFSVECAAAQDEIDEGAGEGEHGSGEQEGDGEDAGDGAVDGGGVVGVSALGEERGEERKRGGAGGLADDGHGCGEEALGVHELGDLAGGVLGEPGEDDGVHEDNRDAEHEGEAHADPVAEAGVVEVKYGLVADAGAVGGPGVEGEGAEEGAEQGPPGERRDAQGVREEQAAEDNAGGVDEGRDALVGELFADEGDGGEDAAGEEEDLRGQEDARHGGGEGDLGGSPAKKARV